MVRDLVKFVLSETFRGAGGGYELLLFFIAHLHRPVNFGYGTKSRNIP